MAAAEGIGRIHHLILVEHPRAEQAIIYYVHAFGGAMICTHDFRGPETQHDMILKRGYVRIGDRGQHAMLEISDTARRRTHHGHPRNPGYSHMCIFDDDPLLLFNQALHFGGQQNAPPQGDGQNMFYTLIDPFGYVWFICSTGFIPKPVLPVARRGHYLLLIPHVHYDIALLFYPAALGAEIVFEDKIFLTGGHLLGRAYLQIGPPGFEMIIQLVDTFRDPVDNRSEEMLYIYGYGVHEVAAIIDRFVQAGAEPRGPHQEGYGGSVLQRYLDPFGYYWSIGNMALLPDELYEE